MTPTVILAKSRHQGRAVTLPEHSRQVLEAAELIFGPLGRPSRLAEQWLRFFGLDAAASEPFQANLWLAAATHDIGKANDGFQRMVEHHGRQLIRHEHLSALLLWLDPARAWLEGLASAGIDPELVASAVVCHHLKVSKDELARPLGEGDALRVQVYADAPDLRATLELAGRPFGVAAPDLSAAAGAWAFDGLIDQRQAAFAGAMHRFGRALARDERRRRLHQAVKAALIAVDSAGSGLVRTGAGLADWLGEAFGCPPLTAAAIEQAVIAPRIAQLEAAGRWSEFHDFQLAVPELGPRVLLLSSCGSGKTLAAWKWIARQAEARGATRAIFLYPTRGTATEGFRDYVSWSGPASGALLSGTARFDLSALFENPGDPRHGGDYAVPERLFALGYWPRRVFSATVDSFLAFVNNRYAALCLLPLLADSVLVVDEVHSFDKAMFRSLDRFLATFDLPVLCMTASLPNDRLRLLRDLRGLRVFPDDPGQFADLARQARAPRYVVRRGEPESALATARRALAAGQRVLWVVNTVARCQQRTAELRALLDQELDLGEEAVRELVICYHSRFRLIDRRDRHEAAIGAFRGEAGPRVLVTTQVCEMSLDLDADVLISELAPVPSLIQRMGRCCRVPLPPPGRIGQVFLYAPADRLPYEQAEIDAGAAFANWLVERGTLCQEELAEYLANLEVDDPFVRDGFTGFLDSGPYALAREDSFRETGHDFTDDAVLDRDVADYLRAKAERSEQAAGYVLPVPRRFTQPHDALGPFLRLAPAGHYSPDLGFLDREVTA